MSSWPTTYMLAARVMGRRRSPEEGFIYDDTNDYFQIRLLDPESKQRFIVHDVVPRGLKGLWFNGNNEPGYECILLKKNLPRFDFQGIHHYRDYHLNSHSPLAFIWKWLSAHSWRHRIWDRWTQGRFNKRGLTRQDRMQVLRLFVSATEKNDHFKVSIFSLMEILYTRRSFLHPEQQATMNYYEMVLKSLVGSGDLSLVDNGMNYRLLPQGLTTLASFDLEERRHSDNIKQQTRIGWLTFALIFIGIIQALATYYAPGSGASPKQSVPSAQAQKAG